MVPLSYNLRNVRQRWQTSVLAVAGIALVVAVLVVLVAMANGFRATLVATGIPDNAIVVQKGSSSELTSRILVEQASLMTADTRVERGRDGRPLASPEIVLVANLRRRVDGQPTNVVLRGVTPRAFEVRHGVGIAAGRNFRPGSSEIVVGRRIGQRIAGLELGHTLILARRGWQVVGVLEAGGSGFESEIWGDADSLRQAFNRGSGWQVLSLRLREPAQLAGFAADVEGDPRLQMQMKEERAYYAEQAGGTAGALLFLAGFVSVVMGIGAILGAMNTMSGIVAARTREIGTLRVLGFSRRRIVIGFLLESTLLALAGGVLGVLLALPAHGWTTASQNAFAELAFAFRITPQGVAIGLGFALVLGVLGGVLPALRAARLPIVTALREG